MAFARFLCFDHMPFSRIIPRGVCETGFFPIGTWYSAHDTRRVSHETYVRQFDIFFWFLTTCKLVEFYHVSYVRQFAQFFWFLTSCNLVEFYHVKYLRRFSWFWFSMTRNSVEFYHVKYVRQFFWILFLTTQNSVELHSWSLRVDLLGSFCSILGSCPHETQ